MYRSMMLIAALIALAPAAPTRAPAAGREQIEVDRVLVRVHNTPITRSDVRQARLLKLVPGGSDEAILVELENRILILSELSRAAGDEPSDADIASRRKAWEGALGGGALDVLLVKAGMNPRELQSWMRDDVRIRRYYEQRFGTLPEAQRAERITEWVHNLRQRAGLK
jgi:hypothetical protein